jgi:hypothetical protein
MDSRLKDLSLPPAAFGSILVPSSVEEVTGWMRRLGTRSRALHFGRESQLRTIFLGSLEPLEASSRHKDKIIDVFIRFSEAILQRFRSRFENL